MDTMILTKKDSSQEEIELIMTFKIENFKSDYVFYRSKNKYYGAKYIEKEGKTILSTNLSAKEKEALSTFFDKLHKGGKL